MTTVRDATFDLFRAHGMTTIFGNPGSTELPMLKDYPADFSYVLGVVEPPKRRREPELVIPSPVLGAS